jgi:hypothetical protein
VVADDRYHICYGECAMGQSTCCHIREVINTGTIAQQAAVLLKEELAEAPGKKRSESTMSELEGKRAWLISKGKLGFDQLALACAGLKNQSNPDDVAHIDMIMTGGKIKEPV